MVATGVLVSFVIIMEISKFSEPHVSMLLGMGLGISASPIMMIGIKNLRSRRKINKILRELAEKQKRQEHDENDIDDS